MSDDQKTMALQVLDREFIAISQSIKEERARQIGLWGDDKWGADKFCRILGEEFGEVCEAAEDISTATTNAEAMAATNHARTELVQVAAVAVRFIQSLDYRLELMKSGIQWRARDERIKDLLAQHAEDSNEIVARLIEVAEYRKLVAAICAGCRDDDEIKDCAESLMAKYPTGPVVCQRTGAID